MARIRNIKPEFFRHETLQELGPIPMLVFAGLWCQCDKAGNFQWKPSQLKLDILPFIEYDIGSTLELLRKSGEVLQYFGDDGKPYGHIPTFKAHQRFFGSEAKALPRFPAFLGENKDLELPRKFQGNSLDRGSWKLEVGNMDKGGNTHTDFQDWKAAIFEAFKLTPSSVRDEMKLWETVEGFKKCGTIEEMKKLTNRAFKLWKPHMVTPNGVLNQWDFLMRAEKPKPKTLTGEQAFRC